MPEPIQPFSVAVPEADLEDLRRRLAQTRWPEAETVPDDSQGIRLTDVQELCEHWATAYDWRATESRLNALPQFTTVIDGLRVHFVHVRSPRADAVPLVLTHGWPGSFLEFEEVSALLADPPAGSPAFHVVVPSLPGYGFTEKPTEAGWGIHRIAGAWAELMGRLGYDRFVACGSDWGTSISTSLAMQYADRLLGVHLVPPLVAPGSGDFTPAEQTALEELEARSATASAYSAVHQTRPQTIGYALLDSPAGLCAWLAEKMLAWCGRDGSGSPTLSRDQVLDGVSLYWLTGTGASAARLYWESIAEVSSWFTSGGGAPITVPTGASVFPFEVPRPSRRWADERFTNIVHWGEPERGGHFAAWEEPALFAEELRATAAALGGGSAEA